MKFVEDNMFYTFDKSKFYKQMTVFMKSFHFDNYNETLFKTCPIENYRNEISNSFLIQTKTSQNVA